MQPIQDRLKSARDYNNSRLWEIMEAHRDDPEGVTREEAIYLAEFKAEHGRSESEIFARAMQFCKRHAERQGMFIPRATIVKGRGYAYVLASRASTALDGYMAQEKVTAGVQRSAMKHEEFIERDLGSLPPVLRTVYRHSIEMSKKAAKVADDMLESDKKQRDELYAAYREEQENKASA